MKPTIVTGHGRSGTHWLAHVLDPFVGAVHEPENYEAVGDSGVVVDCRLRRRRAQLEREGYRIMHLIRDGRDVVRSTFSFYHGRHSFEYTCEEWAAAVDMCRELPTVRLKDLLGHQDQTQRHFLPHWTEWTAEQTDTFWRICGEQMERHGYRRG